MSQYIFSRDSWKIRWNWMVIGSSNLLSKRQCGGFCKSITQAIWHREVWDNILLEIKITETVNKWYIVGNWKPGVFLAKYNTIAFARMIESPSFDTQHSTHLKYAQWGAYTFMKRNYRWNNNPPITKKMTVCPPITNIVCYDVVVTRYACSVISFAGTIQRLAPQLSNRTKNYSISSRWRHFS